MTGVCTMSAIINWLDTLKEAVNQQHNLTHWSGGQVVRLTSWTENLEEWG